MATKKKVLYILFYSSITMKPKIFCVVLKRNTTPWVFFSCRQLSSVFLLKKQIHTSTGRNLFGNFLIYSYFVVFYITLHLLALIFMPRNEILKCFYGCNLSWLVVFFSPLHFTVSSDELFVLESICFGKIFNSFHECWDLKICIYVHNLI